MYRKNISRERAVRVAEAVDAEPLSFLASSDVYWDAVVSVDPAGRELVYDLTVEGQHNFVANNILVHNSIEQDADIVAFIHRKMVPVADGMDPDPSADLIIAKHRNGPTGIINLLFQGEFTSFRELERETNPAPY